ncbi:signal recognition particle, SRP9/SRP14 subunit [Kockovaella imperatae]|uniref:Signal recognition particle, SRP9/SRP14 subunit n=1 Tax=Kockovaella imperatae TaxID=4999 RepID=A0A1Y1UMN4_9TREE|nr:signal recognition particle, SRP9/SRP14 subunit [Kockovaella imperatae]ORX39323.1 signal recognition particle, SRP9/SRP14 subunit [Kockovaella imperatae]
MVYIKSWTDFETAATDLYAKGPTKVRYLVKFLPKTGQLALKLTDDTTCIKYKTFSSIILNRFESLNLRLLSQMTNSRPRIQQSTLSGTAGGAERATSPGLEGDDPMTGAGSQPPEPASTDKASGGAAATPSKKGTAGSTGGGAGGGGGGKKKKKGKK